MYRIGVISDTHGLLRKEVLAELEDCDAILHGGDIHRETIVEELKAIAPLHAVRGNADGEWAKDLPVVLEMELYGIFVTMAHNRKDLPENIAPGGLVVFGHSHKYADQMKEGIRWLNPGSCGGRRFHLPVTMAVIETEGRGDFDVRRIDIAGETHMENLKLPKKEKSRRELVQIIMKEVDKGRTVERIAKDHHISVELSEQVCRMYLTHPGVDVEGILSRIG